MESTTRTIVKAATWQATGLLTGTLIAYVFTGSFTASGGIALSGAASGAIFYVLHERLWARVGWGRDRAAAGPLPFPDQSSSISGSPSGTRSDQKAWTLANTPRACQP